MSRSKDRQPTLKDRLVDRIHSLAPVLVDTEVESIAQAVLLLTHEVVEVPLSTDYIYRVDEAVAALRKKQRSVLMDGAV